MTVTQEDRRATPSYDRHRELALHVTPTSALFDVRELRRLIALEQARSIITQLNLREMNGSMLINLARSLEKYLETGQVPG